MYLDPQMTAEDRVVIMKLIYGPQRDKNDFHYIGFDAELLAEQLHFSGFCFIQRVKSFNIDFIDKNDKPIFDTSDIEFKGYFISLNMVARACPDRKPNDRRDDDFIVEHHSIPYEGNPYD
jgi:hypothetical protein